MTLYVLDASALLARLLNEDGASRVRSIIDGATVSAVNLAEVVGHYARAGAARKDIEGVLEPLPVHVVGVDAKTAYEAGMLRAVTGRAGLSLGDRTCLATAKLAGATAVTADKAWATIAEAADVHVEVVR